MSTSRGGGHAPGIVPRTGTEFRCPWEARVLETAMEEFDVRVLDRLAGERNALTRHRSELLGSAEPLPSGPPSSAVSPAGPVTQAYPAGRHRR